MTDLIIPSKTDSSVTLVWTAPGDDGAAGTAAQYDIRYSTVVITDANFNSATQATDLPVPSAAGTGDTLTVAGLTENTTYYFALKTADEVPNWSALSNVANVSTDNPPASQVPHISYFDQTNFYLKYAAKSGGSWTLETVDAAGAVGWYTSLVLR